MKTAALFLFIFLTLNAFSQIDSVELWKRYEKEVIYFSGSKYIKNNTLYRVNNLKTEFEYSPLGKEVFKMYQKERKFFYVFYGLGFVSYSGGIISLLDRKFTNSNIFLTGAVFCWSAAFSFSIAADKKLKRSVWIRNRDMLYINN